MYEKEGGEGHLKQRLVQRRAADDPLLALNILSFSLPLFKKKKVWEASISLSLTPEGCPGMRCLSPCERSAPPGLVQLAWEHKYAHLLWQQSPAEERNEKNTRLHRHFTLKHTVHFYILLCMCVCMSMFRVCVCYCYPYEPPEKTVNV